MFRVFFDMDGTLAEWKAAKEPEDLYEKDYFLSLKRGGRSIHSVCGSR